MILDKLPNLALTQFSHLYNRNNGSTTLLCCKDWIRWSCKALITVIDTFAKCSKIAIIIIITIIIIAISSVLPVLAHADSSAWLELSLICKSKSYQAFRTQFKYASTKPSLILSSFFPGILTLQSHLNIMHSRVFSPSRLLECRLSLWLIFESKCQV